MTIFGGSVGGASVTYLMASPLAQGTDFKIEKHRDIIEFKKYILLFQAYFQRELHLLEQM